MRIRTFLKPLSFLPAIFMMYIIFTFSSQTGDISASMSYQISYRLVKAGDYAFDVGLDDQQISTYAYKMDHVTRKLAHMTEYFLLAVSVSFPLYVYGLHGILLVLLVGLICIGFACGDEYHQSFVAGRSPSLKDVGIDGFGVLVGIILVRIIGWTGRHTVFRPVPEDSRYRSMTDRQIRHLERQQKKMQREWKKQQAEQDHYTRHYNIEETRFEKPEKRRDPYGRNQPDPRSRQRDYNRYDPERDPRYQYSPPDYEEYEDYEEEINTSDELSEDMPIFRLFQKKS